MADAATDASAWALGAAARSGTHAQISTSAVAWLATSLAVGCIDAPLG
jgi:hypothetical protein